VTDAFFIMSSAERGSSYEGSPEHDHAEEGVGPEPVPFDWEKRWLKGHEYHHILKNIDAYCKRFGFKQYEPKSHPKEIYSEPVSNLSVIQTA
jgi:hypothetical protein